MMLLKRGCGAVVFVFVGAIIALTVTTSISSAAEVRVVKTKNCYALLSGRIETGDARKIHRVYKNGTPNQLYQERKIDSTALCLNSTGGSYREAVLIMKILIGQWPEQNGFGNIGTVVDKGMVCRYACAIAFLGGSAYTGAEEIFTTDRTLNASGMLAFGLPPLSKVREGGASSKDVQAAYNKSIKAISELLSLDLSNANVNLVPYDFLSNVMALKPGQQINIKPVKNSKLMGITYINQDGSCWTDYFDRKIVEWVYKLRNPCSP